MEWATHTKKKIRNPTSKPSLKPSTNTISTTEPFSGMCEWQTISTRQKIGMNLMAFLTMPPGIAAVAIPPNIHKTLATISNNHWHQAP